MPDVVAFVVRRPQRSVAQSVANAQIGAAALASSNWVSVAGSCGASPFTAISALQIAASGRALPYEDIEATTVGRRLKLADARIHIGRRRLQLAQRLVDCRNGAGIDAVAHRAEQQVGRVDALLGRVVQLPCDPAPLAVDREGPGALLFAAQADQGSDA